MHEPWKHHAKWKVARHKSQCFMIPFIWNLQYRQSNKMFISGCPGVEGGAGGEIDIDC